MARHNGTPSHQEFLADLFEEWSEDELDEIIFDARAYADDRQTGRTLTRAAEIAGTLAEAELDAREALQRKIRRETYADLDAMGAMQREAEAHDLEAQRLWDERVAAGVCPF